jgi:hypothetical protein
MHPEKLVRIDDEGCNISSSTLTGCNGSECIFHGSLCAVIDCTTSFSQFAENQHGKNISTLRGRFITKAVHERCTPTCSEAMGGSTTYEDIIESIRSQCMKRGLSGIKGLAVLFRGMDRDYSKTLSFDEFRNGMKAYQIQISEDQLLIVFRSLDKDGNNQIDFREFLTALSPPMNASRVSVINEAFDKLDANRDGVIKVEDLVGESVATRPSIAFSFAAQRNQFVLHVSSHREI